MKADAHHTNCTAAQAAAVSVLTGVMIADQTERIQLQTAVSVCQKVYRSLQILYNKRNRGEIMEQS